MKKCASAKCLTGAPRVLLPGSGLAPRIAAHSRTAGKGDLTFEVWIPVEIAPDTLWAESSDTRERLCPMGKAPTPAVRSLTPGGRYLSLSISGRVASKQLAAGCGGGQIHRCAILEF